MNLPPRRLSSVDRPAVLRHYRALTLHDRYLRFGGHSVDSFVTSYVARFDFSSDAMFGATEDGLSLIGVAHLARCGQHAELGLSVLPSDRNKGIGRSLLLRGYLHARNWGAPALCMHCLAANVSVIRLARGLNMEIVAELGDAEAWLKLPPPDASSVIAAALSGYLSQVDYVQKLHRTAWTLASGHGW